MIEDPHTKELIHSIYYGQMECILECQLDGDNIWCDYKNRFWLLAVITLCSTASQDATRTCVM